MNHLPKVFSIILVVFLFGCSAAPPLIDAVYNQNYHRVVDLVENAKHDVNCMDRYSRTPLIYAADYSYTPILEYLLQHGAELDDVDSYGKTALHYAVYNNSIAGVKLLLEKGVVSPNS